MKMQAEDNMLKLGNRIAGIECYQDKTVFVTGASGFVGKVYIEKLLRTCPLVKKIYVLVRCKRNKDPFQRVEKILNVPLFDLLKKEKGADILKKVVAIPGDITEIGLGISPENREILRNEVQIIIHSAATVRFNEPLRSAVLINVRGTKFMLDLAKECKNLLIFSHISTAYSQPDQRVLEEKVYPPPADPHSVIRTIEWLGDDVNGIRDKILGVHPNSYSFTKALAEDLVFQEFDNLPVIILRPSVVVPTWKEPIAGWADNLNGITGILIAGGKGLLRTQYCDTKRYADFIPVDIFVNVMLLTTFDFLHYRERRIYNCISSFEIKMTWEECENFSRKVHINDMPFNNVVWCPKISHTRPKLLNMFYVILFHYIPALILDLIIILTGNKPGIWKLQQKISEGCRVLEYYCNNQWIFKSNNIVKLRSIVTEEEMKTYSINFLELNIEKFFIDCNHGARLYILNEPDSTIPSAKKHMKIMWTIDKVTKGIFWLGLVYLLYTRVITPIFGI